MVLGTKNNTSNDLDNFVTADLCHVIYSKLYQYQCSGTMCDVTFSNGDLSVSAHSCIMAVVSPFMMRYFLSHRSLYGISGVCQPNIIIPISVVTKMVNDSEDNCMECFTDIIKYIYTGIIGISQTHFQHIANISCNLEIDELISICQKYNIRSKMPIKFNNIMIRDTRNNDCDNCPVNLPFLFPELNIAASDSIPDSFDLKNSYGFLSKSNKQIVEFNGKKTESNNLINKLQFAHKGINVLNTTTPTSEFVISNNPQTSSICNCFDYNFKGGDTTSLSQHKLVFHSDNFHCIYCSFKSRHLHNMNDHLLNFKHGNKCSICLKELPDNDSFFSHLNEHQYSLPLPSNKFISKYKTKVSLKKHLPTHGDMKERIYQCFHCNIIFSSRAKIKLHLIKTHKGQICHICGYATKYSSYLKRHLLKHERKFLYCSFNGCNFQTNRKSNLKDHFKIHKRISKEFDCSLCNTSFTLKKNLQRHMIIHNNPRLFECPECEYKNNRFDKVKDHCRIHRDTTDIFEKLSKQNSCLISKKNNDKDDIVSYDSRHCSGENSSSQNISSNSTSEQISLTDTTADSNDNDSRRVIYLNETTGELNFFCDSDGKALKGVPDTFTVHSIGNITNNGAYNPEICSDSNSTSVILNEITGELNYIHLHLESTNSKAPSKLYAKTEVAVTVLDEATGEITSKSEQLSLENDNSIFDFENIFESIDFDAMNDDSLDGFDDFDNALFDAEFSIGSASPDMDKVLNEFTGELFIDESACKLLDKPINNDSIHPLWSNVQLDSMQQNTSQVQELAEIFLNEVTGEFTAELSSLKATEQLAIRL